MITVMRANKGNKANLKSHFNRIHPDQAKQVNEVHRLTKSKAAQIVNVWLQAEYTDSLADKACNSEKVFIDFF